jgi:hypothetical protein
MSGVLQSGLIRDQPLAAATAIVGILLSGYYLTRSKKSHPGAPITDLPGPWRVPVLGNVNFPTSGWSDTFNKWREEMGE